MWLWVARRQPGTKANPFSKAPERADTDKRRAMKVWMQDAKGEGHQRNAILPPDPRRTLSACFSSAGQPDTIPDPTRAFGSASTYVVIPYSGS